MAEAPIRIGMRPSHPGEFLRAEFLDELDLSTTQAAERLGVPVEELEALVSEHVGLTAEMAGKIEDAFGVSADLMLRLQRWHAWTVQPGAQPPT